MEEKIINNLKENKENSKIIQNQIVTEKNEAKQNNEIEGNKKEENTINEKIIKEEDYNDPNIETNQKRSDPDNYELEHECSIENIDKIVNNEKSIKTPEKDENIKINEIEKIKIDPENLKCNKEYKDNNEDLTSIRFEAKDNNSEYLIINEDNNKNPNTNDNAISDNEYESDKEEEEKKEDLFPFRIIGDARKKSEKLGVYNLRYLEIDSIKGTFTRYKTSKDYPKKPNAIVNIKDFKLLR